MRFFRRSFAFAFVFVLLASVCFLQPAKTAARTRRCPVRIPDSLLTLYLKSDLVVVAAISSEEVLEMTQDYDYGSYYDVRKTLKIADTLKGQDAEYASFHTTEFKPKPTENAEEESEEIIERSSVGDRALFFLVKDDETNKYELADGISGLKELENGDLDIYKKRIEELKEILAGEKHQLENLTEWLVTLVENPVTRYEGMIDLEGSFSRLNYEAEDAEESEEPVVADKNFRAGNTSAIAKLLTGAQKERLTGVLLFSMNEQLAQLDNSTGREDEEISPDYALINLVGNWDKIYPAMVAFAHLQNAGGSNPRKVSYLFDVINFHLDDEQLYSIVSDYNSSLSAAETDLIKYPDKETVETETPIENDDSTDTQQTKNPSEETNPTVEMPKLNEPVEKTAAEITYREYREKLLEKFAKRYGSVISGASASR